MHPKTAEPERLHPPIFRRVDNYALLCTPLLSRVWRQRTVQRLAHVAQ